MSNSNKLQFRQTVDIDLGDKFSQMCVLDTQTRLLGCPP